MLIPLMESHELVGQISEVLRVRFEGFEFRPAGERGVGVDLESHGVVTA